MSARRERSAGRPWEREAWGISSFRATVRLRISFATVATVELHIEEGAREMDEVTREVKLGAVREEVWAALTDPERLGEWLGEILAVELTPGGELVLRLPDGEERHGFVEAVDPPSTLLLWWRPVAEGGEEGELTRVEVLLEPSHARTPPRVYE